MQAGRGSPPPKKKKIKDNNLNATRAPPRPSEERTYSRYLVRVKTSTATLKPQGEHEGSIQEKCDTQSKRSFLEVVELVWGMVWQCGSEGDVYGIICFVFKPGCLRNH